MGRGRDRERNRNVGKYRNGFKGRGWDTDTIERDEGVEERRGNRRGRQEGKGGEKKKEEWNGGGR